MNFNVNRYNNINVNNRINSNNNYVNWRPNAENRNGVPYRDANTRNQSQRPLPGVNDRQDCRGRDAQRQQAAQALSNRVGAQNVNRDALSNVDRSSRARARVRDRACRRRVARRQRAAPR